MHHGRLRTDIDSVSNPPSEELCVEVFVRNNGATADLPQLWTEDTTMGANLQQNNGEHQLQRVKCGSRDSEGRSRMQLRGG